MNKLLIVFILSCLYSQGTYADKVLVTIGKSAQVTEQQLETAMQAAPFATQFPAMDEQDQAYLRGDMLLRMARAEALYLEAISLGINKSLLFQREMGNFKTALLAQRYLKNLRNKIQMPQQTEQKIAMDFQGNNDALLAARSAYIADQFYNLKSISVKKLIEQSKVKTYYKRLDSTVTADTVLAEGTDLSIRLGDLFPGPVPPDSDNKRIKEKVDEWINLLLMAKAAAEQGENVDSLVQDFAHNLTIKLLLADKEQHWLSTENILLDYFKKHPEIAYIPERRQIGQIVLNTEQEAKQVRNKILAGESLFELAGQISVDPYGRQRSGDMGWLTAGSAAEPIEQAIQNLKDNEVSEVVKTSKGWHLIVIVNRKPAERKKFEAIKDRVRQKFIAEKMTDYLQEVIAKYPLQWQIKNHNQEIKTM